MHYITSPNQIIIISFPFKHFKYQLSANALMEDELNKRDV